MKLIPLTQGQSAIVDDGDFERLNAHKWHAKWDTKLRSHYAARNERRPDGKQRTVRMHREITGAKLGQVVDHINHNTLDNRKSNLRACAHRQNMANQRVRSDSVSGVKGVSWYKPTHKWRAQIAHNGTMKHIGYYLTKSEAASAFDSAVVERYGEFALTNQQIAI